MKKRYVLAALAAMVVLAGCGGKASTDNTDTQNTQDAQDDSAAASMDDDELSELDPEFSQDLESNEEIDAVDDTEETALDPITPSDYLVKNASDYVTIGDYSDVEVTKYTYEITDDMVQEEIQEELESYSEEESTNAPSEDGNIVYMNLTATVDGEAGDEEETFIILGQEEYGAEFDEKLTGVSAGDQLDFSVTYGDDTWQEDWQGKTVDFKVEVTDVTKSNTPEYNDDYVKNNTDYDTKADYEAAVKENLQQSYDEQSTAANEPAGDAPTESLADKMIYSANLEIQTTEYDAAIAALESSVTAFGGFVEQSNTYGDIRYNDDGTSRVVNRMADYVVRVPAKRFQEFLSQADGLGNVLSCNRYAENVTSHYTDQEARLASLYTQEERLLSMLEKSEDVESLIALEERLADVRYEIESIERNLRNLDRRIAYSSVTISLHEVEIYTPTKPVQRTFGEKLSDALTDGWRSFSRGVQYFLIDLVYALPGIILFLLIAGAAVLIALRLRKKHKAKKAAKAAEEAKDAQDKA